MSDIDAVAVDGLKALDPKRPIREADIRRAPPGFVLEVEVAERLPVRVLHDEARIVFLGRAERMERGSALCRQEKKNPKQRNRLGCPRSVPQTGLLRAAAVSGDGALPGRPNSMN